MPNPAIKGFAFERKIAKMLGLWWTQDDKQPRDDIFWRTAGSGGRATQRRKTGAETAFSEGDTTFIHPSGRPLIELCFIEVKKGYTKELDVLSMLDGKSKKPCKLLEFWLDCEKKRMETNRKWSLLIFQRNHKQKCIMLDSHLFGLLENYYGEWDRGALISIDPIGDTYRLIVVLFEEFLKWASPEFFKEIGGRTHG